MNYKISVALITLNEQKNIKSFLDQFNLAEEIIIVDSYSKDKTIEIANQYNNVKIYYKKFTDFSSQKNYAISLCKNDWILFFDADERIRSDFWNECMYNINSNKFVAFYMKRIFYVGQNKLKYSGFQNDYAIRIFNKKYCIYNSNKLVHEQINTDKKIKKIKSKIDHYSFENQQQFNNKLDLYSYLRAKELKQKNIKVGIVDIYIKPLFRFLHHFLFRYGFLDGREGLKISLIYMNYVRKRYYYLNKFNNKNH